MRTIRKSQVAKTTEGKDFNSQRVYIAARADKAARITFDGMNAGKISARDCNDGDNIIVNCALLLEDTLEKLVGEDLSKISDPIVIFVPGNFADQIHNKTYLYWLMKGTKMDGTELAQEELDLWDAIDEKLAALHRVVILKNIASAKLFRGRGRQTRPTWIEEKDNELQQVAWNRLPAVSGDLTVEEEDGAGDNATA